ncbi:hypothetical protein [Anaerococcus provencensis]|uniref:hypothetical protein n=1 Tax=Anaerococcus provencensis TaxID=938293 RepID=UPI00030B564E|nr:hypothetical protein [Anaerococcus provencensis]
MGSAKKNFYRDIDDIYDYYKKNENDRNNLSKIAKYHLKVMYSKTPDQWDELSRYDKDKFLYYDLKIIFFEDNDQYFDADEIEKINKKIRPGMENLFNANSAINQYNKMNDLMYKKYFEEDKNYTKKQIDTYYREFSDVFNYFLPKTTPPSKEEFKKLNLRVYDYFMSSYNESYYPLSNIEKYGITKNYSDISHNIYLIIEYILESRLRVKIDYKALAESLAITQGYTSYYEIEPYPDSYPTSLEEVKYQTEEEKQEAINYINDTNEYIIHRNKLQNKEEFIIDLNKS